MYALKKNQSQNYCSASKSIFCNLFLVIFQRHFYRCNIKSFSWSISTTNLLAHIDQDHKISTHSKTIEESTKSIQQYFETERNVSSLSIKKGDFKFVLIRDLALLCCKDLLPFDLVDG